MTVRRACTRWRIVAVLAATAAVFGAWLFLHLPATHAAEWVIARIGFPRYERSLWMAAIAGALLTFAMIWVRERSFAGPSGRSALLLLAFVAVAEAALIVAPVEHVHFPQYALIAAMIWLAGATPERAWAAATLLGAADEAYQLLFLRSGRPDYFDWNDVFLNAVGAAYGVLIVTAGSTRSVGRFLTKKSACASIVVAAGAACVIQPPDVTPYWTLTPRGRHFRILSAVEAIGLLGLLWWTLRRRFIKATDRAGVVDMPRVVDSVTHPTNVPAMTSRLLRSSTPLMVAAIGLPPAAALYLILSRGANIPYFDEWSLVPFVLKAHVGTLTWSDLWAQHNEHRIAAVRLIVLLLLPLAKFNVVVNMLVAFGIAVAALSLTWRALRLTFPGARPQLPLALALISSLFMFSTVQWETWLYSLPALQGQLSTFCAIVAVWAMSRWPGQHRSLVVAGVATVVSMTALASGLALWCAASAGTLFYRYLRRQPMAGTAILAVAMLMSIAAAYLAGYERPPSHPDPMMAIASPVAVLQFIAAYVALPLTYGREPIAASAIGALALVLSFGLIVGTLTTCRNRSDTVRAMPWIALWLYALMVAGVTALGRAGLGLGAATTPRYATTGALFWLALIVLAVFVWDSNGGPRARWRALVMALAVTSAFLVTKEYGRAYRTGFELADRFSSDLASVGPHLMRFESAPDSAFERLYPPSPVVVRRFSGLLRYAHLGPFAEESTIQPANEPRPEYHGFIDAVSCISITGWAIDYILPGRSFSVDIYQDDHLLHTAPAVEFRRDLRDAGFGTGLYGFSILTPAESKDGRPHRITLRAAGTTQNLAEEVIGLDCESAAAK